MKPCFFIASSKADIADFPESVRSDLVRRGVGYSLFEAQTGLAPLNSKPLKGFDGRSVVEVVEDHRGDTYRAVYTVRFAEAVDVLHAFKKKSLKGNATPKHEIDLIKQRLKAAEAHYQAMGMHDE